MNATDVLTFRQWHDALLDEGAPFDSPYVERFWLPVIGATQVCLLRQIGGYVKATGEWQIEASELAARMGIGGVTGSPNRPLPRALARLCGFGAMRENVDGITFDVRLYLPTLTARQRKRLPLSLRDLHERIVTAPRAAAS